MKTDAIREALIQYVLCGGPRATLAVGRALEELGAIEAAQATSRFASGPSLSPDVARRISEQLGATYPPACGLRSFVEDAQASASVRAAPIPKSDTAKHNVPRCQWHVSDEEGRDAEQCRLPTTHEGDHAFERVVHPR